jgi:hypothetical protein
VLEKHTDFRAGLHFEYPPAMQSAGGWNTNCGTNINIEMYRESAQRHCGQVEYPPAKVLYGGQVEQGISKAEVF